MPTRIYHDHEPKDIKHIVPAMKMIKENSKKKNYSLFMYSSTANIIQQSYFRNILDIFVNSGNFDGSFVVDEDDYYYPIYWNKLFSKYDIGMFIIEDSDKLEEVKNKIPEMKLEPIVIDFSVNNNISKFVDLDCIYIKIISIDEAEKVSKFLGDLFSGKILVKEDEFYKVKEQIIRYYFSDSNMTERLKIPTKIWKNYLRFFQ
jgi:hypothetical protein